MKSMILAAGLGSRLNENTQMRPKALVEVKGYPILYYQLNALKKAAINDLVIVLGYRGELIKKYINKYHNNFNVKYVVNNKYDQSNSSYSFWLAKDYIMDAPYIHLNCDVLFSNNLLCSIIESPFKNIIVVRTDVDLSDGMENVIIVDNKIINMSLRNTPEMSGKAFGLAKFCPESTNLLIEKLSHFIEENDLNQNYYGMIRLAVKEMDYYCIISDRNNLIEINTVGDLNTANNAISASKISISD